MGFLEYILRIYFFLNHHMSHMSPFIKFPKMNPGKPEAHSVLLMPLWAVACGAHTCPAACGALADTAPLVPTLLTACL